MMAAIQKNVSKDENTLAPPPAASSTFSIIARTWRPISGIPKAAIPRGVTAPGHASWDFRPPRVSRPSSKDSGRGRGFISKIFRIF